GEQILLAQHARVGRLSHRAVAALGRELQPDQDGLGKASIDGARRGQRRRVDRPQVRQQHGGTWSRRARAASATTDHLLDNRVEPRLRGRRLRRGRLLDERCRRDGDKAGREESSHARQRPARISTPAISARMPSSGAGRPRLTSPDNPYRINRIARTSRPMLRWTKTAIGHLAHTLTPGAERGAQGKLSYED